VFGGGLSLGGTTTLATCTVSGNTTSGLGGGIALFALSGTSPGTLTLNQTSVTGNTADDGGGGIYVSSGTVTLQNGSQVTGNTPDDCVGC
jgi:predicted outer membrane repeat protein